MSKIPLAKVNFDSPEAQASAAKTKFRNGLLISFLVLTVGGGFIALLEFLTLDPTYDPNFTLHLLVDAFGLSGILGISIFFLGYASSKGAFDILSYSLKLVILNVFAPKYRQDSFPKTFYDYKVKKDHEGRKAIMPLALASILYLVIGIVLLLIYMNL